jgi:caffeoyl-CoA O-methyltransferase
MTSQKEMSEAEKILCQIEKLSEKHFLPIVGPAKGEVLAGEVRKAMPERVIEVGTLIGYSAILIGRELDANAEIVSMEVHADEAELAKQNIKKAGLPMKVSVLVGDAKEVIPTLLGMFDFAFIDAEKDEYYEYLRLLEDKLCVGAVVVADNAGIFADQVRDYLDYVRGSGRFRSRFVRVGRDGLEISVKL